MSTPVMASERDLRTLAGIVSEHRADLPEGRAAAVPAGRSDGPDPLRCHRVRGFDSGRQSELVLAAPPGLRTRWWRRTGPRALAALLDCQPCSYPDRTGDLRSIIKIADFYSARQWHSTGMYCDIYRPLGMEHELMLSLPDGAADQPGPGRTVRLSFPRARPGLLRA